MVKSLLNFLSHVQHLRGHRNALSMSLTSSSPVSNVPSLSFTAVTLAMSVAILFLALAYWLARRSLVVLPSLSTHRTADRMHFVKLLLYTTILLSMFASLCIAWSLSCLVRCHSPNNLLFSDTAFCTASFHHHDSFSRYSPGVDSPNSFFASCIILEYVSFQFVSFPSASTEQRCSLAFEMSGTLSSSSFN